MTDEKISTGSTADAEDPSGGSRLDKLVRGSEWAGKRAQESLEDLKESSVAQTLGTKASKWFSDASQLSADQLDKYPMAATAASVASQVAGKASEKISIVSDPLKRAGTAMSQSDRAQAIEGGLKGAWLGAKVNAASRQAPCT